LGAPLLHPRIEPNRDDLRAAADALAKVRCNLSTLIAIFAGSGSPAKNWPLDKFATLARILSERSSVVFILGPAEFAMEKTLRGYELPVLIDSDLGTVAGIARLATGFVGNDSGVSHLAAGAGAPGVVIFGASDPIRWRPLGRIAVLDQQVTPDEVATALIRISDRHAREKHSR